MFNLQRRFLFECAFKSFFWGSVWGAWQLLSMQCLAQNESNFAAHLYQNALYEESIAYVKLLPPALRTDSVLYYTGCSWLAMNKLNAAQVVFSQVLHNSRLFHAGMGRLALATLPDDAARAAQILDTLPAAANDSIRQYHRLLYAGSLLLAKQPKIFSLAMQHPVSSIPILSALEESLWAHYERYIQLPQKKPWVAGALSAVVPGAGKYYAGKKRSAAAALLQQLVLGALVWDSWRVDRRLSPQMIIASSLFTVFYVGNIWGSTLSVGVQYREKYDAFKQSLLLDLRLPIRYLYP